MSAVGNASHGTRDARQRADKRGAKGLAWLSGLPRNYAFAWQSDEGTGDPNVYVRTFTSVATWEGGTGNDIITYPSGDGRLGGIGLGVDDATFSSD